MRKYLLIISLFLCAYAKGQTVISIGADSNLVFPGPIYIFTPTSTATHSWNMCIYTQQEIISAGGYAGAISEVAWDKADTGGYLNPDGVFEIYIKHTTMNDFPAPANFNNEVVGATLVYSSTTQTLVNTTGWINFVLNNSFPYNGLDNIMILTRWVRIGNATGPVHWKATVTPAPRLSYSSSPTTTMGTLTTNGNRPNVQIKLSPQAVNDAGITSIDSVRGRCAGANDIFATFMNYGSDTITSVDVQWELDGVAQTPYNYTGNLPPGSSTQVMLGNVMYTTGNSHTYKVWTDNPNASADTSNLNDTVSTNGIAPGLNGTYTIGSAGDFHTFTDAANSLADNGVCGPVEIVVDGGVYAERVVFHSIANTSFVNTVTIHSATNDSSTVSLEWPTSLLPDSNFTMRIDGVSYLAFKSITFARTGVEENSGVVEMVNGTNHITFENNRFIGPDSITVANTTGSQSGLFCPGTEEWHNITIRNNYFLDNANGVWVNGASTVYSDSIIINDNYFETSYVGAFLLYTNASLIHNNFFMRNNTQVNTAYYAMSLRYGTGTFEITNNKVVGYHGSYGIRLRTVADSVNARGLIANNFIQCGWSATGRGIAIEEDCGGINIFNNSVNYTGTTTASGRAFFVMGSHSFDLHILNNIFSNNGGGYCYYIDDLATGGISQSDYNCFYTTGSNFAYVGVDLNYLSSLQISTGKEAHSKSGDPIFNTTYDLHTTSAIVSDGGTPLISVPTDIDGDLRSPLTPDIGADEFLTVGVFNSANNKFLSVYPNPVKDQIRIENDFNESWSLTITDINGKEILHKENLNGKVYILDLPVMSRGVYVLKITSASEIVCRQIIKQ